MANTPRWDFENMEDALEEIARLRRQLKRSKQDNQILAAMNINAEKLRLSNEKEKMQQRLYNDLLLEYCPSMLFFFSPQLRLLLCSRQSAVVLTSPNWKDLIGRPLLSIFNDKVSADWVQRIHQLCAEVLETGAPQTRDDAVDVYDGRVEYVQMFASTVAGDGGGLVGVVLSIANVTALTEAMQRAEEAANSKSSFLANMSHEIRTPMNAIKGFGELLRMTELSSLQRSYVSNILASSASLLDIINDVLDFSKIDAGKIELVEGPYSLADMLGEVSNVVSLRAAEKGLDLLVEAAPDMPRELWGDDIRLKQVMMNLLTNAVKYTNEGRVWLQLSTAPLENGMVALHCQVTDSGIGIRPEEQELLFNAFTRADLRANRNVMGTGLGLAISRQLAQLMGGDIEMESVYGQGSTFSFTIPQKVMDPAPLARVAEPESLRVLLLGSARRMQSLAAQLQLLLVDFALEDSGAAGGQTGAKLPPGPAFTHCIYDEAEPPEAVDARRTTGPASGAQFAALRSMQNAMEASGKDDLNLFAPVLITDLAQFLNRRATQNGTANTTESTALEDNLTVTDTKVLVVDDNQVNLMVGSEMLALFGAGVDCAASGKEAIEKSGETLYDLIFMDHMMPGMDGVETTRRLREEEGPNQHTPIIALTANVVNNMESYYLKNGMDDFIGKPIELAELARVLARWLPGGKVSH